MFITRNFKQWCHQSFQLLYDLACLSLSGRALMQGVKVLVGSISRLAFALQNSMLDRFYGSASTSRVFGARGLGLWSGIYGWALSPTLPKTQTPKPEPLHRSYNLIRPPNPKTLQIPTCLRPRHRQNHPQIALNARADTARLPGFLEWHFARSRGFNTSF